MTVDPQKLGMAFRAGMAFSLGRRFTVQNRLAQDEAKWITVHPNGKGMTKDGDKAKGQPVLIDGETGEVLGGMGGKFTGKHISAVPKRGKEEQHGAQAKIDWSHKNKQSAKPLNEMSDKEKEEDAKLLNVKENRFDPRIKEISKEMPWGSIYFQNISDNVDLYVNNDDEVLLLQFPKDSNLSNAQIIEKSNRMARDAKLAREKNKFNQWKRKQWIEDTGTNPEMIPESIAGVDWNYPMSREAANDGSVNPNFDQNNGYDVNCQTCVVAFEARLRGYRVTAKNNTKKEDDPCLILSKQTNLAWIDPKTGYHPEYLTDLDIRTPVQLMRWLESKVHSGERYTMEFGWEGMSIGHIVCIDRMENGTLRLYDPQDGSTLLGDQIKKYANRIRFETLVGGMLAPTPPKLLRIDDKILDKDFRDRIFEKQKSYF